MVGIDPRMNQEASCITWIDQQVASIGSLNRSIQPLSEMIEGQHRGIL